MAPLLFPPQNRRDGRSAILGLLPAADTARAYNWERLDNAVGMLDAAIAGGIPSGAPPDGSITTAKLAPGATVPAVVQITNTSGLGVIPATDTLLSEWTVAGLSGRPVLMQLAATYTIGNTTGGITNPSDLVFTLRQGGAAGSIGTLVWETPPIVMAVAQNQQGASSQPVTYVWVPGADGALRWSITARLPSVAKNTATLKTLQGVALTFA